MSANENDLNLNHVAQPTTAATTSTTTIAAPAAPTATVAQADVVPVDSVPPAVTPETGQLDARFALWRDFCLQTGVDVETLPSELKGNLKDSWEAMKDEQLTPVRDEVTNTPVTTQS